MKEHIVKDRIWRIAMFLAPLAAAVALVAARRW